MSWNSYKKYVDAQLERERKFAEQQHHASTTEYVYIEQPKSRKFSWGWLIFSFIVLTILVVAAIKNPSASETRALLEDKIVEKINEKMKAEMMDEENDGTEQFAAFLGMLFAPHILDLTTNIVVNDYVIFSTFSCNAKDGEEVKTIVSGIIVFGNVIPLESDLSGGISEFE